MNQAPLSKAARSWAMYDWANSAFVTVVVAGFFPVFFKTVWNEGVPAVESTFRLGLFNSGAAVLVALSAPLLGCLADAGGKRKQWLAVLTAVGGIATIAMAWMPKEGWFVPGLLFGVGVFCVSAGYTFYDSLLIPAASGTDLDRLSVRGYAMGYLGGGLAFLTGVIAFLKPSWFGFSGGETAVRFAFTVAGLWWLLFSIPLFRHVPEGSKEPLGGVWRRFRFQWRAVRSNWELGGFLIAYWIYIDGVYTVIKMAVDYGLSIGLEAGHLITALLITQFVGFPATYWFGNSAKRWGLRRSLFLGLGIYLLVSVLGTFMSSPGEFYALAVVVGLVQGGVQALSRSWYAQLVPEEQAAAYFGFFNMVGRSAAIVGPLVMGLTARLTGEPRYSILSVSVLFLVGGFLLYRLPTPKHSSTRDSSTG